MKTNFAKYSLYFIVGSLLVVVLSHCATDSRRAAFNLSIIDENHTPSLAAEGNKEFGAARELLLALAEKNRLLATELGKLPELQNGVTVRERQALEKSLEIYEKCQDKFNEAFETMFTVGKPEARKHCSPLQAIYWLIEDGRTSEAIDLINNYNLKRLLDLAWGNETELAQTKEIYRERNKDFYLVVARLNSPELVDYYTQHSFRFYFAGYVRKNTPPSNIFYNKKGTCYEYSLFMRHCLKEAGYEAYIYHIPKPHKIVGYKAKDGKWYSIDNGRRKGPAGISGPYESETELQRAFSCTRLF